MPEHELLFPTHEEAVQRAILGLDELSIRRVHDYSLRIQQELGEKHDDFLLWLRTKSAEQADPTIFLLGVAVGYHIIASARGDLNEDNISKIEYSSALLTAKTRAQSDSFVQASKGVEEEFYISARMAVFGSSSAYLMMISDIGGNIPDPEKRAMFTNGAALVALPYVFRAEKEQG